MKLATLCYVRQAGKTLMVHRIKKPNDIHAGKWNGLGGKLEPGETPEECAIREILEESGLRVQALALKGILTFPKFAHDEDWYAFVFLASVAGGHSTSGGQSTSGGEMSDSPEGDLAWIDDERLPDLNLWEGDRIFLPWLERPGFFSAKFTYQDGGLVDHSVVFYD